MLALLADAYRDIEVEVMLEFAGMNFEKTQAELVPLRDFIDFVNAQVGVYMDCLSGFRGNTVRIERQVARVNRPQRIIKDGEPVMMLASFEDPTRPDAIHHRIIAADEFIRVNRDGGFNHRQVCWSIIVFMFAYWDEEIRPQIAAIRGIQPNDIKVDALGDLRVLRNAVVHNKGLLVAGEHSKLRKMADITTPSALIALLPDQMHRLFVLIKQAIAELVLEHTKHLPGAPDPSEIVGVAIHNAGPRKKQPGADG